VQLSVVVAFGVLCAFARKTIPVDATFEPVPWALAVYFAFTVARLIAAYRSTLPRWFLALSVIIDMVLLLGLIWSFHLQYMQPPAFYLKAPTVLYVLIFIALRALRFEARFVMLAGVVAALGWLALVAYAITANPADHMIIRDYIRYMTWARVLLGAEFDKVISILVVTLILAVAIIRARLLLVRPGHGEVRDAAILQ
jgi:adenylate cyclase